MTQQTPDYDANLESLIESKRAEMVAAGSAKDRRDAWYEMKALIECRSAAAVRRMERDKGLSLRGSKTV